MALALDRTDIGVTSAPPSSPSPAPMATSLGRFVLLRELGAGAMGIVYAAYVLPLLQRGLATEPAARWPDMDALLRALDRDPQRDPSSGWRERRGFAVLMAVTILITTATIVACATRGEIHAIQPFELVLSGGVAGASILIGTFGRLILALAGVESLVIVRADFAGAALLCLLGGLLVVRWYLIVGDAARPMKLSFGTATPGASARTSGPRSIAPQ